MVTWQTTPDIGFMVSEKIISMFIDILNEQYQKKTNLYGAVIMHLTCNEKIRGSNPRAGYLILCKRQIIDRLPAFCKNLDISTDV